MTSKIKIYARLGLVGLFLAMAITIVGQRLKAKALTAEKTLAKQTAALAATEAQGLRRELEAGLAALTIREEQKAELAAQTEALRHELSELYQNNLPCATWADADIPNPVLDRLRR